MRWILAMGMIVAGLLATGCTEAGFDPVSEETCTSGERWTGGDSGSSEMHPGLNCIGCHTREGEGPVYAAAGTVMQTYTEKKDCRGVEGIQVVLTGANGQSTTLTTNAAGNFYVGKLNIELPYTAKVIGPSGAELEMTTPQMDGDCANCHTDIGVGGAPGRIIAPM